MSAPTYIYPPVTQDPGALYDGFVSFMQTYIPDWKPYSGELDDWLARAFTAIGAQLMEIESDVATSIYRYFGAYILNYPPYEATPALGTVTITVKDSAGYDIPAYVSFTFPDGSGQLQPFETTSLITVPEGQTAITMTVQAMTPGSAANGCAGDGNLDSSTPITFITGLSMAASSNGGTDDEEDQAYLNRLASLMTTITPSPVTVADFTTIAMTQPGVGRAFTLPTFDPAAWTTTGSVDGNVVTIPSTGDIPQGAEVDFVTTGTPVADMSTFVTEITSPTTFTIDQPAPGGAQSGLTFTITGRLNVGGKVCTWVTDDSGQALTGVAMAAIQSTIQEMCLANVDYAVLAPTYTQIDVVANVVGWPDPNNPSSAVQAAVEAALTSFLQPNSFGQLGAYVGSGVWLNETTVRVAALQTVVMNVPGVHYATVTINGASNDVPLSGVVPLPRPGAITVNVTQG